MARVQLIHWNASEAQSTIKILQNAGFQVQHNAAYSSSLMRDWRQNPPAAFVIDLSRLPSHGKEIAIALRQSPKTKQVPLVFCDGTPEKREQLQKTLPDAAFCTASNLVTTLKTIQPLASPVQPPAMMQRYGGRIPAQKLGIAAQTKVTVLNPPGNLSAVLGPLPADVEFTDAGGAVTLCFIHSADELRATLSEVRGLAAQGKLWILWQKQGAPNHSGITDVLVRETGMDVGLVDYKVCAVDQNWSGILFAKRKSGLGSGGAGARKRAVNARPQTFRGAPDAAQQSNGGKRDKRKK
jgi:CheY-like chemotaxis protein